MFDLPVVTKRQRRAATTYRKNLLRLGFTQVQLSVYAKYVINGSGVRPLLPTIRRQVPPDGAVRMLRITDEQWATMDRYYGQEAVRPEPPPSQLALFDTEIAPENGSRNAG